MRNIASEGDAKHSVPPIAYSIERRCTKMHTKVTMGDIGEEQEEVEVEPLTVPVPRPIHVPSEPVPA